MIPASRCLELRIDSIGGQHWVGTTPIAADGRFADRRHLAEREVFVEPLRRQAVHRTVQKRDECAAGRVGTPGAAIEIHRHIATGTRVLEQAEVVLRRAQQHRHLVEADTLRCLVEHAANDLDGFAAFARRRKQADVP